MFPTSTKSSLVKGLALPLLETGRHSRGETRIFSVDLITFQMVIVDWLNPSLCSLLLPPKASLSSPPLYQYGFTPILQGCVQVLHSVDSQYGLPSL